MALPSELFTAQSMLTLGGATAATVVICNSLQASLNFNPKWLALLIAQAISFYGTFTQPDFQPSNLFVAMMNGFLIYCTATGTAAVISSGANASPGGAPAVARDASSSPYPQAMQTKRRFRTPWF